MKYLELTPVHLPINYFRHNFCMLLNYTPFIPSPLLPSSLPSTRRRRYVIGCGSPGLNQPIRMVDEGSRRYGSSLLHFSPQQRCGIAAKKAWRYVTRRNRTWPMHLTRSPKDNASHLADPPVKDYNRDLSKCQALERNSHLPARFR